MELGLLQVIVDGNMSEDSEDINYTYTLTCHILGSRGFGLERSLKVVMLLASDLL